MTNHTLIIPDRKSNLGSKTIASWVGSMSSGIVRFPRVDEIMNVTKGKQIVMFLDYDGTLSPIFEYTDQADMVHENKKEKDQASYLTPFHTVILTIMAIVIGLIQITPTTPQVREPTIHYFLVIGVIYIFLLGFEMQLREKRLHIHHFISHFTHVFGSLATNVLVSLIFPIFAIVVAILCLCWFFFDMYRSFPTRKVPPTPTEANQPPPV